MAGSQESLRHAEVVVADHDACEHVQLLRALGDMTLSRPLDPADHATALLALLLSQPLQASAWPVAVGLIGAFGSVSAVFAAQRTQLAAVVGMTEAAVNLLQTMRVALCWAAEEALRTRDLIASAQDVRRYLQATMRGGATEIAHGLFQRYRQWLGEAGLFDLNLVSHAWRPLAEGVYDLIVIDEVQDLTGVQLALLLASLNRPGQFLLCGDVEVDFALDQSA